MAKFMRQFALNRAGNRWKSPEFLMKMIDGGHRSRKKQSEKLGVSGFVRERAKGIEILGRLFPVKDPFPNFRAPFFPRKKIRRFFLALERHAFYFFKKN